MPRQPAHAGVASTGVDRNMRSGLVLLATLGLTSCTSRTAPLGDFAGRLVSSAVAHAGERYDRRRDPDYRRQVQASRWAACQGTSTATRVIVPDGEARLPPDDARVRVVRYADCKIDWLEGCRAKRSSAYGERVYLASDARRAETSVILDEVDLYDRFPAFSAMFGARIAKKTEMHVEVRLLTKREIGEKFGRSDLEPTDACAGATHWVAVVEYGALRVNFDPSAYAGENELEAQKVLGVGSYAACVREEPGACNAAVAITIAPLSR